MGLGRRLIMWAGMAAALALLVAMRPLDSLSFPASVFIVPITGAATIRRLAEQQTVHVDGGGPSASLSMQARFRGRGLRLWPSRCPPVISAFEPG